MRAFEAAARLGAFAAAGGSGVLIGHGALVAGHLEQGRLELGRLELGRFVAPFGQRVTLPRALRLRSARPLKPGSAAHRVAQWLQSA